jgi:hypothetical protein
VKWYVEIAVEGLAVDVHAVYEDMPEEFSSGFYDRDSGRQETNWWIDAITANQAMAEAKQIWRRTFGNAVEQLDPVGLSARTTNEQHRSTMAALNMAGELVSITDIAKMLGVSHQRASTLSRTDPDFPEGADFAGHTLYLKFLVHPYVQARKDKAGH